jgi:hypothetical protein
VSSNEFPPTTNEVFKDQTYFPWPLMKSYSRIKRIFPEHQWSIQGSNALPQTINEVVFKDQTYFPLAPMKYSRIKRIPLNRQGSGGQGSNVTSYHQCMDMQGSTRISSLSRLRQWTVTGERGPPWACDLHMSPRGLPSASNSCRPAMFLLAYESDKKRLNDYSTWFLKRKKSYLAKCS